MIKRLTLLCLLSFCLLPLPVAAEPVPEENPIGETMRIEEDDNYVKNNIDKEKDTLVLETSEVVVMTEKTYFRRCVAPFIALFGGGIALYMIAEGAKQLPTKKEVDAVIPEEAEQKEG